MSKKKLATLALLVCFGATAIAGASLAYFTDTDQADNVFTVGGVDIKLIEQERAYDDNEELTGLKDFEDNKMLMPIVGSAQGDKDEYGLPVAKNYVDKIITVENLKSDAYVRVYLAVPTVLDNVGDASQNVLHFNGGNKFVAAGKKADGQALNADYANWSEEILVAENVKINNGDIAYNVYAKTYNEKLSVEETGSAAYVGFYLDSKVDYVPATTDATGGAVEAYYTINGKEIDFDFTNGVTIPVYAVGVQADGFANAAAAFAAAFNETATDLYNPWN